MLFRSIEPADGINIFRESKLRKCPLSRMLDGELREHAERFVERDEHGAEFQVLGLKFQVLPLATFVRDGILRA